MITWTDSARAALENHNQRVRPDLAAGGADPDEVAADLQRHIEEELTAAKIHVATRDEVQRVLGKMGVHAMETSSVPPKPRRGPAVALVASLLAAGLGVSAYFFLRPAHREYPGEWLVPTSQDPSGLSFEIPVKSENPSWARFQPGDSIEITSVKGDRRDIGVGGRYLIQGTYSLSSMDSAGLSASVTAPSKDAFGAISPGHPEEGRIVIRGTNNFSLIATMRYPGRFHVSFRSILGGESRGSVYFDEAKLQETKATIAIVVGDDGRISVNGIALPDNQLGALLKQTHADHADASVLIKADEKTNLKQLSFVMDSCRTAGITRFALQAR
jgi:Biopolymer transport protein ExbD/TolR